MHTLLKSLTLIIVLITAPLSTASSASPPPASKALQLLFIGNSYTYFNDFPPLLETLLNAGHPQRVKITAVTEGGATLQRHWLKGEALAAIQSQRWDYVILQEHSQRGGQMINGTRVISPPALSHIFTRLFDQAIKQAGAKTLLTQTWARQGRPEQQPRLDHGLVTIARELKADIIPVGRVWQRAAELLPGTKLYTHDGSHPSPMGSLVRAGVFYRYLLQDQFAEDYAQIKNHPFELTTQKDQSTQRLTLDQLGPSFYQLLSEAEQAIESINADPNRALRERPDIIQPPQLPSAQPFALSALAGRWVGELDYYPERASLSLDIQKTGETWHADVRISQADGTVISTRQPLRSTTPSQATSESFYLYLEASHDSFQGVLVDDDIIGVVRGDHARYPETNRWGRWRLRRQP
jgi:hypothetical protein